MSITGIGKPRLLVSCFFLFAFLAMASLQLFRPTLNRIFLDETAHASYIVHLQKTGHWWPNLEDLPMIDKGSLEITNWRKNYLNHPPFYYKALAMALPQLEGHPEYIPLYRAANIALIASALCLLYAFAAGLNLSLLGFSSFCALCTFVPWLPLLSATISNDNLGIFSGALSLYAVQRFLKTQTGFNFFLILISVLLAAASKLTCFIFVAVFAFTFLAPFLFERKLSRFYIITAVAIIFLSSLPYFVYFQSYGSPAPLTSGHLALIQETSEQLGWANSEKMSPLFFVVSFFFFLTTLWSDTPLTNGFTIAISVCVFTLMVLFSVVFVKAIFRYFGSSHQKNLVLAAGGISLGITLLLHVLWSYKHHVTYGYILGAYPRYYYPALGLIAYALIEFFQPMQPRFRKLGYSILILLPIIFMASSFSHFLLNDITQ